MFATEDADNHSDKNEEEGNTKGIDLWTMKID